MRSSLFSDVLFSLGHFDGADGADGYISFVINYLFRPKHDGADDAMDREPRIVRMESDAPDARPPGWAV